MTSSDQTSSEAVLALALRDRAADVGDEDELRRRILAKAAAMPQRRRPFRWLDPGRGRVALVFAGALITIGLVSAAVGGLAFSRPPQAPTSAPSAQKVFVPAVRNGPLLVRKGDSLAWIDPSTDTAWVSPMPFMPDSVEDAAWSRDGRMLATVTAGDVVLIDPIGGERRVLASCIVLKWVCDGPHGWGRLLDWSPDGTAVAVTDTTGLFVVDVKTGSLTTVVAPTSNGAISSPSWSPDGRSIAFEAESTVPGAFTQAGREIDVVNLDGSDHRRISAPFEPETIGFAMPTWSRDGTTIIYLGSDAWKDAHDGTGGWVLSIMGLKLSDGGAVGTTGKLVDAGTCFCLGFTPSYRLSPDGTSVAVDTTDGLVIARVDGLSRSKWSDLGAVFSWRPVP